jgi:hypothetical protein
MISQSKDAPRYFAGYGVGLAMMLFCALMSTIFAFGLRLEDRRRDRGERDERLAIAEHERENLGDDDPRFRFTM